MNINMLMYKEEYLLSNLFMRILTPMPLIYVDQMRKPVIKLDKESIS